MKSKLRIVFETLVVGILVFALTATNLFSSLDYMARDGLYQSPRGIKSSIKIIGIDEKTLDEYGPIQTWSRQKYADLINKLNEDPKSKPMMICFDIVFSGNIDEGDDAFVKAAKESGNVCIVNQFVYEERVTENSDGVLVHPIKSIASPYDELANVCDIGYSNVALDSDGTVRRIMPTEKNEYGEFKMFSKAIYDKYCEISKESEREIPTDKFGRSIINYSGKPGDYECVSLSDVLSGKIDSRAFTNSIVFVGAYAPGMQDNFRVPNGGSRQMYGVEIHANILQAYMDGRFAVNGNPYVYALILAILAMLLFLAFRKLSVVKSVVLMVFAILWQLAICVILNNHGLSFSIIYLPLILILAQIYVIVVNYVLEKLKRRKVLNAFKKYVAPQIVDEIAGKGDFNIKLGGENRDIAVLFVDIRGFTTMSEALPPEKVVEILNEYLSLTTKAIFDNMGTLDKFVGDATMAVFNSPFDLDDYEFKAVCAAKDIVDGGNALEKELFEKYGRTVGFGVGVHCGPAVVGNVGCDFRMDFTAIGDTVNTSARLEANAAKGQILISDVLYERLKGRIKVNEIGNIPLKGKSNGVMVYEVTDIIRGTEDGEKDS